MKILHTSDWHIGKKLDKFSRLEEQVEMVNELARICEEKEVDCVLIAGDLYDTYNPATESIELLYKGLKKLSDNGKRPVIAIAGNHDSPDKIDVPVPLANECGIILIGYPNNKISKFRTEEGLTILNSEPGFIELKFGKNNPDLRVITVPYANEFRLKKYFEIDEKEEAIANFFEGKWKEICEEYCDNKGINILLGHLLMTSDLEKLPEEPDSEKSILHIGGLNAVKTELIPTAIQYAALGHLHKFQSVDKKVFYCGSPLQYSMSEANQEKYAVIVDLDPDYKFKIEKIKLKSGFKIYRKTFNDVDKAVEWLKMNRNCYVELTFVLSKYLDAEDRKKINEAHQKIVNIIFEISDSSAINKLKNINAVENEEIEVLFRKYFKFKNKVEPDEELLELFKVIVEDGELVL